MERLFHLSAREPGSDSQPKGVDCLGSMMPKQISPEDLVGPLFHQDLIAADRPANAAIREPF